MLKKNKVGKKFVKRRLENERVNEFSARFPRVDEQFEGRDRFGLRFRSGRFGNETRRTTRNAGFDALDAEAEDDAVAIPTPASGSTPSGSAAFVEDAEDVEALGFRALKRVQSPRSVMPEKNPRRRKKPRRAKTRRAKANRGGRRRPPPRRRRRRRAAVLDVPPHLHQQ